MKMLYKVSYSIGAAKKVFDKRFALSGMARSYANTHADPYKLINYKTSVNKARHLVRKYELQARKLEGKVDTKHLDTRKKWAENKAKYGKRNPSTIDKVKYRVSGASKKIKEGLQ